MLGVSIGTSVGGCSSVQLAINLHGWANEYSDWGFSDVVVWNRVLPYSEMKKVSNAMLKSVCGGSHYWNYVTNVCTACPVGSKGFGSSCICNQSGYYLSVLTSSCTLCPVGSNSTGSSCTCVGNTYFNIQSNICTACPVGSNSTGSTCTCVGNTYFNRLSSTCDPYFSDGVIGDAPWGIWRAQSYDAGSPLVLRESRGNGQDIIIQGSITINNSTGNGALNPVYSLQGGTSSTMLWPTELTGDFTVCSLTRYTGNTNKGRVLNSLANNWFQGHHGHNGGLRGCAHYDNWRTTYSSTRGTLTDWLVMCGQNSASSSTAIPNNIIADGRKCLIPYRICKHIILHHILYKKVCRLVLLLEDLAMFKYQ